MSSESDVPQVLRALAKFALVFILIWLGLHEVQRAFPYLQTGSDIVLQTKLREERTPHLFKNADAEGLLFFGNSKALSGFVPDLFDSLIEAAARPIESYNLGLPGNPYFVDRLSSIFAAGNVPKYILITVPWMSDERGWNLFHFVRHDSALMDELFPFHILARDVVMAAGSAIMAHRPLNYYETNRKIIEQMISDRGFFFIYDVSEYTNGQLPADLKFASDDPTQVPERHATTHDLEFQKLNRLLTSYHVTCLLVPTYWRRGQFAVAPRVNQRLAAQLISYPQVELLGPDYILLDNRYFADRTHLNRAGAGLYTKYLADLVAPYLR